MNKPDMWSLVYVDMEERNKIGWERYGHSIDPHDGRDWLMEAYFEALDQAVYIRTAIFARDGK